MFSETTTELDIPQTKTCTGVTWEEISSPVCVVLLHCRRHWDEILGAL